MHTLLLSASAHILTDGDVEAIDAEGGTPTLPESMLLRVGFHCFCTLQSPPAPLYNLLSVPLFSCGVLFQFIQITVLVG